MTKMADMTTEQTLTTPEAMRMARKLLRNVYQGVDDETAILVVTSQDPKEMRLFLRGLKQMCNTLIKALKQ